ncbi:Transcription initiation factor TFIID subunit 2 [Sphaceloma murrayae]|uniref:Transcription initiation factor TFIID subunit 2 n=1 Tax=Sphaceloma murrayae TaxID=2082308 RepID=A0A2K1QZL7_9PEZI|nr:Transcription initiation factor TFIID subunit 2 [Sphaceloma murrayae]
MPISRPPPVMTEPNRPRASSSDSASTLSLKTPRTARFAEATAVNSPLETRGTKHFSFSRSTTNHLKPQPQPADVSFGASIDRNLVEMDNTDYRLPRGAAPLSPAPFSPALKSALRTPGTSKAIFSPTFKEENDLEKAEVSTDKEQAKDLKVKTRVRIAKFLLRGVNFSCSLIVLAMLTTVLTIFNATKAIPPRFVGSQQMRPWAVNQQQWPQITILSVACVSLAISILIFWQYFRGGHSRVEKAAIYYTVFAVGVFVFSIVMWIVAAVILQTSKNNGGGQDMWGWSCNNNLRSQVYGDEVDYALVCRLQNWSLICCIIEVIVEVITIAVYGIVFYRYWTKRKLRKSMSNRDKARSDLYLAQLRSQSAPNTPGWNLDRKEPMENTYYASSEEDERTQYVHAQPQVIASPRPFVLQPAPRTNATSQIQQTGFTPITARVERTPTPQEVQQAHAQAAPGEVVYDSVPIPGAYAGSPMQAQFSGNR